MYKHKRGGVRRNSNGNLLTLKPKTYKNPKKGSYITEAEYVRIITDDIGLKFNTYLHSLIVDDLKLRGLI